MAIHAIDEIPAIRLELEGTPEAPAIVRGALSAVGEQLALDPEFVDDLKTAVTEACNNAVMHAYEGAAGPLETCVYIGAASVLIAVRDEGVGIQDDLASDEQEGVGVPIIQALAGRSTFRQRDEGGTEVWMDFPAGPRDMSRLKSPPHLATDDHWTSRLSGDTIISLSPVSLINGVLGRVARALAARARFSLDRFSDVYLATDAIATHAVTAASGARIEFGVEAKTRHLEITIGPFRSGANAALAGKGAGLRARSALALLADELEVVTSDGAEILRVVIDDHTRPARASAAA
jgi:serine/threonine-protein kinase RsbW